MIFTLKTYDKAHKRTMKKVAKALARLARTRNVKYQYEARYYLHLGQLIVDRLEREINAGQI